MNFGTAAPDWEMIVRENAEKALALDPTVALAHVALGTLHQLNWEWDEAERSLRRALELRRRAAELSPNDVGSMHQLGVGYRRVKDFVSAAEAELAAIALAPDGINAHVGLAQVEAMLGNSVGALEQLRIAERLGAGFATFRLAQMALVYFQIDRPDDVARLIGDLENMDVEEDYRAPGVALAAIVVGDYDRAYELLQRAIEAHSSERISLGEIKANYWSDPVLEEPRFKALRDRIGAN